MNLLEKHVVCSCAGYKFLKDLGYNCTLIIFICNSPRYTTQGKVITKTVNENSTVNTYLNVKTTVYCSIHVRL